MGMHHGLIAAELPWPVLRGHLAVLAGTFAPQGPSTPDNGELGPNDAGWRLLAGELDGKAYVLDTSMLSMGGHDALAEVARRTGALVAACGAETVSGSVSLFAARGPQILRWYEHCDSAVACPLQVGTPLPVEQGAPFGGAHGEWLAQFGFDSDGWLRRGTRTAYQFTPHDLDHPNDAGPLERQWDAHYRRHALPPPPAPPLLALLALWQRLWKRGA